MPVLWFSSRILGAFAPVCLSYGISGMPEGFPLRELHPSYGGAADGVRTGDRLGAACRRYKRYSGIKIP